jgi:hypothetical protein
MTDCYSSPGFKDMHTLRRRLGPSRIVEEHPYEPVFEGLPSLSGRGARRHLFRRRQSAAPARPQDPRRLRT